MRSPKAAAEPPVSEPLDPGAAGAAYARLARRPGRQLLWKWAQPLVDRWGPDVFLVRSLLVATLLAATVYSVLLALRTLARGESPLVTVAASVLLLGALVGAHRMPRRALPLALLAGAALPALTIVERPYDPMVFGLYCLALVLAALVLNGREIVGITAHYFLYYALFNVLIADPTLAPRHWESLLAALLVFAGISMAVWSLVAGQRWLRASRTAIQVANARLEATLSREQRFVGDAAHQLRTPLAILRARIGLLLAQPSPDPPSVLQTLAEVAPEIDRLGRTVDDLLALSRADAGMAIAREPVDVLELADAVFSQGRRLPGGQRLVLDPGDEPADWDWLVRGDEHLLQQLLLNLVDNALKYSPIDEPVVLGLAAQPSSIIISVSDRGVGIPPEERERIFERFYRAPQARASRAPGSGLGLCLARWIAEAHGGQLTVDSEPGQGSVFRLRLSAWEPIPERS